MSRTIPWKTTPASRFYQGLAPRPQDLLQNQAEEKGGKEEELSTTASALISCR